MEIIRYPDRATWLALRQQDLTASDVAAACGVSPWATPLKIWAQKLGLVPPVEETAIMRRGRWFEAAAMAAMREQWPDWDIRRADVYVREPSLRLGATPDFLVERPDRPGQLGNVQVKTVALKTFKADWTKPDGTLEPPIHVQLQAITEAKLIGADWTAALAMIVGDYHGYVELMEIPMLDEVWTRIKQEAAQFAWHIDNKIEPPVIPSRDYTTLREMFPKEQEGSTIDLSQHNQLPELLAERGALKESIKMAEGRIEEIETEVLDLMKDNATGTLPGWSLSLKTTHRKEYTVKAAEFRTLRINKLKDK
jgi:predicted phage-related endonuclease